MQKLLRVFLLLVLIGLIGFTAVLMRNDYLSSGASTDEAAGVLSPLSAEPTRKAMPAVMPTAAPEPSKIPESPRFSVTFVSLPENPVEGTKATFTWNVNGLEKKIRTTAVYFGSTDTAGALGLNVRPEDTKYGKAVTDFLLGEYRIPLQFVGSVTADAPGTYFARAYALIDGKHYWSAERMFSVAPAPKYDIRIVSFTGSVKKGENASFTWDVSGPPGTTGFTAIVGGRVSNPGTLSAETDLPKTPYAVVTRDFTSGTYNVPLRFVGNFRMEEAGTYYMRALAFINGKNIWSDEFSITVTE